LKLNKLELIVLFQAKNFNILTSVIWIAVGGRRSVITSTVSSKCAGSFITLKYHPNIIKIQNEGHVAQTFLTATPIFHEFSVILNVLWIVDKNLLCDSFDSRVRRKIFQKSSLKKQSSYSHCYKIKYDTEHLSPSFENFFNLAVGTENLES